jgi:hypothetical protein
MFLFEKAEMTHHGLKQKFTAHIVVLFWTEVVFPTFGYISYRRDEVDRLSPIRFRFFAVKTGQFAGVALIDSFGTTTISKRDRPTR